jgi:hypothetical protein
LDIRGVDGSKSDFDQDLVGTWGWKREILDSGRMGIFFGDKSFVCLR